jgi:hypothetical protein
MALELGYGDNEAQRWYDMVNMDFYTSGRFFTDRWETDTEKIFTSGKTISWVNFAYLGMSMFPNDYA